MKTTTQFKHLLAFEFRFFFKKYWIYLLLLAFSGLGFLAGASVSAFSTDSVYRNSPFSITYMLGYLSLLCIFLTTILAAQILFREQEYRFSMVLYTTPLRKSNFFLSRFLVVFGITTFSLLLLIIGFMIGQQMSRFHASEFGPFHMSYYLQPFLLLIIPNTFFCSAVVCSVGLLSKNKLLVYISGLFIFIGYQIALIFSGSPLIAGALPPTEESMQLAARLDPFGLSAFLHQTLQWSVIQRNTQLTPLSGSMLFNRLFYTIFSTVLLLVSYKTFRFSVDEKRIKTTEKPQNTPLKAIYKAVSTQPFSLGHRWRALISLIKIDLIFVLKSIPFLLILIGIVFFVSMEMYGEIEQGVRIPELYVSTSLMTNTILETFPVLCTLVILFYSNELLWRSRVSHFHLIENTMPVTLSVQLFARWFSMASIIILLLIGVILAGVVFQIVYDYVHIEWTTYIRMSYFIGLPLLLSSGFIIAIQTLIKNRYAGLVAATIFVLLTTTSIGTAIHLKHPLLRVGAAFGGEHSAMNGFGANTYLFGWRMLFGTCLVLIVVIVTVHLQQKLRNLLNSKFLLSILCLSTAAILAGVYISTNVEIPDSQAIQQWQEEYEKKYRPFQHLPQPAIKAIQTRIDLFPEGNSYEIWARYTLKNTTKQPITKLLFYISPETALKSMKVADKQADVIDEKFGHYWVNLTKPLLPDNSLTADFEFRYVWNQFTKLTSFNAIVENGAFMRISNYFPQLGYQADNEINNTVERKNRKLGEATPLKNLEAPREAKAEWLTIDMQLSTSADQIAIGVGELINQWVKDNRNYFHYKTDVPLRFRFGVSSARYAIKKDKHRGIGIEVYYHPAHAENVEGLITNAKNTLDYCETNFGKYPFRTIRFAEISAFTKGFAATAYPATVFMTENMVFHANIKGDNQQDIINELAGHELSHQWWGTNLFFPDRREGSGMLSETFAMYTELMLVKKMYGQKRVLENVKMHKNIYLNDRGFSDEQALYKTNNENAYLFYSKGLVTMYQLSELIGENHVNVALRNLYQKYAGEATLPISDDFLHELYAITDSSVHSDIDDLFKKIIIYKPLAQAIKTYKVRNQYETTFELLVHKYQEDGKGKQTDIDFNGNIEISFNLKDDKKQIMSFPVSHNKAIIRVRHSAKPLSFTLDPNEKLMKTGDNTSFRLK